MKVFKKKKSGVKFWPTKKILEVLNDPYGRTSIGSDYEERKDDLAHVLWARQEKEINQMVAEQDNIEYQDYLDTLELNKGKNHVTNEIPF